MPWQPIVLLASLWLAAGMTFASILYRRGHDGWHWMLVCGIAGPFAALLVADQARFVEPEARPHVLGTTGALRGGLTVVIPTAAVGAVGGGMLDRLGLPVERVAIAAVIAFEHVGSAAGAALHRSLQATLAEATHRFAPHAVELVVLPGRSGDAIAAWAHDHAPAVIVTTRGTHEPRTLGRLARLAAGRPGVSLIVLDPTALAAAGQRAA